MTTPRNTDQLIKAYLAAGPVELPDRSFDIVRDEIEHTRQRPAFPRLGIPALSDSARLVGAAAAVLIAVVAVNLIGPLPQRTRTRRPPREEAGSGTPGSAIRC